MLSINKITPTIDELERKSKLNCPITGCDLKFENSSNLNLHITKHHKKLKLTESLNKNIIRHYHCPHEDCNYFDNSNNETSKKSDKFFSCLKYLRQHYFKVHAMKTYKCGKCEKTFSHATLLKGHERICGELFACDECGWKYNSREALLTHGRRKHHKITKKSDSIEKQSLKHQSIQTETNIKIKEKISKTTQTILKTATAVAPISTSTQSTTIFDENSENENSNLIDNSSQTINNLNNMSYFEDSASCFGANQFSIETQTDQKTLFNLDTNLENLDQMFYSNMYTQTCDEILSDLGLSNIQTQTQWDYNELLVSTETQTCFSKCLLENSSIQTQTSKSMEFLCDVGMEEESLNCNSIQTQTS